MSPVAAEAWIGRPESFNFDRLAIGEELLSITFNLCRQNCGLHSGEHVLYSNRRNPVLFIVLRPDKG